MNGDPAMVPVERWPGLSVSAPVVTGARSEVWRGSLAGRAVAIRRSKRSIPSLQWELELLAALRQAGFVAPEPIPTADGSTHWRGWNVQSWIEGEPPATPEHWQLVTEEIRRIHRRFRTFRRRPDTVSVVDLATARQSLDADLDRTPFEVTARCLAHFDPYLEAQQTVIHGDLHPGNIRISPDGRVGLIDWDEARVDVADLDLSNLGQPVLSGRRRTAAAAAANAWEALNGWFIEPAYARTRLDQLPPGPRSGVEPAADSAPTSAPVPDPTPTPTPTLSDGRITLRARTVRDVEAQMAGEDGPMIRWLSGGPPTVERVRRHIENLARCGRADGLRLGFGIYLDPDDDGGHYSSQNSSANRVHQPLIGNLDCNFADLDLELDEVNLSYGVFGPWRRQGHASAALRLVLDHLDQNHPALVATVKIDPENTPSMALVAGLGFRPVRTIDRDQSSLVVLQRQ